jgi:hypothetical protein
MRRVRVDYVASLRKLSEVSHYPTSVFEVVLTWSELNLLSEEMA